MSSTMVVYLATIAVSVAVALLLSYMATSSARVDAKYKKRKKGPAGIDDPGFEEGSLNRTIFEEIADVADSPENRVRASRKLAEIFKGELESKIGQVKTELDAKYKGMLEEKSQNEEVAWKKYKKVLLEKEETEAVVRSVAEGLVVVDSEGKVVMMNPAAEKMLQVSQKDKVGKPIVEGLKKEQLVSLAKESADEDKEIELVSPQDETKKILRASSAVIEDKNGRTVGMVSVLSDVTKQKELDQLKTDFVANVTHELRTPLVSAEKSISLLLDKSTGQVSETQEEFLTIAQRNLKRLGQLVNDLLDLSKLEAGKMELKRQGASLEKIVDEVIQELGPWIKVKSVNIGKKISSTFPEVNVDSLRIKQVFTNLIGNSLKFTPAGGSITIEALLGDESEGAIVSVEDTGTGISEEDLPKIFDKFYRAIERSSTDISGTGIGLSIVKEIVEQHGGRVWVESRKGQGARFTFTLPLV